MKNARFMYALEEAEELDKNQNNFTWGKALQLTSSHRNQKPKGIS